MKPPGSKRPFLNGSFRFLSPEEFEPLPIHEKTEYLEYASKAIQQTTVELRAMIAKRDAESDN